MGKGIFKKPYRAWVHFMTYALLIIMVFAGCFATVISYMRFQQIIMEPTEAVTTQELITKLPLEIKETAISQSMTDKELSELFFSKLQLDLLPLYQDVTLEAYYYDTKEEISYINLTDGDKLYSLVAHTELEEVDDKIELSFSNFKIGKYKIRTLGAYYSYKFDINKTLELDFNDSQQLIYINQIKIDDDHQVVCNYTYNMPSIVSNFKSYKNQLDPNKLAIYAKDNAKVEEFTKMMNNTTNMSEESIRTWFSTFCFDKQVLEECALTLKDEGIREICHHFQLFYKDPLQAEELVEASQGELDYALNQYHSSFSKMLLKYLYKHKDYRYEGQQLLLASGPIDAKNILNENGEEHLYDVELISNDEGISASYHADGIDRQKLILRKE